MMLDHVQEYSLSMFRELLKRRQADGVVMTAKEVGSCLRMAMKGTIDQLDILKRGKKC